MAAFLNRFEFKQQYPVCTQGLFIICAEKRLPKDQVKLNIGACLSEKLKVIPCAERRDAIHSLLAELVEPYKEISLVRLEVLFTHYLEFDVIRSILALCRNRKVCILWPGIVVGSKFVYASPERPEYYECDPADLQDTYIVKE